MSFGLALGLPRNRLWSAMFSPLSYFAASEQGVWYDPSDMATMFQDSAGTTPVTAMEQPAGLMLDKRLGLVRGVELVTNFSFVSGVAPFASSASQTLSQPVSGTCRAVKTAAVGTTSISEVAILSADKWYEITYVIACGATPVVAFIGMWSPGSAPSNSPTIPANTTVVHTMKVRPTGGGGNVRIGINAVESSGATLDYMEVSVRELPGNHATQATAAARPVLSARKNLASKTEDFGDAAWVKYNGITASGKQLTFTNNNSYVQHNVTGVAPAGAVLTVSFIASISAGTQQMRVYLADSADGNPSYNTLVNLTTTPTRFTLTATFDVNAGGNLAVQLHGASLIAPGTVVTVNELQVEAGSVVTRYQRVNTATDYDTVGFPFYGRLDRVDDNIVSASGGGGGTTGILICAAINASGAGSDRTIWSDRGTNAGYRLSVNASNQLVLSAGNGTAHTEVVGPTITAGTDYVVTGWHDGANLRVQVNAGTPTAAAFGTATAGTAGFTIGKDNDAASGYYGERIYELVYRKDDASTAQQRTNIITYMAAQAGITL